MFLSTKIRSDFAWLNDNSDGPEWVLMEVKKPRMRIFNKNKKPSSELNSSIEQVKAWQRHFVNYPYETKQIFGAVAKFRYILVVGAKEDWDDEETMKWRKHNNCTTDFEIRTSDIFSRAIDLFKENPEEFWGFEKHPITLEYSKLQDYWKNYAYMDRMRQIFL